MSHVAEAGVAAQARMFMPDEACVGESRACVVGAFLSIRQDYFVVEVREPHRRAGSAMRAIGADRSVGDEEQPSPYRCRQFGLVAREQKMHNPSHSILSQTDVHQ